VEQGETVLRPLREYGPPLVDKFAPMPYNEAQRMADFLWPPGLHSYWKSSYLKALDDAAIDIVVDRFARVPSRRTVIILENYANSAWSRVPESATAFGHRTWPWTSWSLRHGPIRKTANATSRGRASCWMHSDRMRRRVRT
jgi:hypothetical protein